MIKKLLNYIRLFKRQPYWFIRLLLSRIFLFSGLSHLITIKLGDVKLKFFPTRFSADLWFPRKNILSLYNLPFLKEGGTVIDVGANIGLTTILLKKFIGPRGRIFSFEPDPRIFGYMKNNIDLNKLENVFLFNNAVGEREEKAYLRVSKKYDTGNSITSNEGNGIVVDMMPLDNLLKSYKIDSVDLLKIDTEGYEKFVLLGAREILLKTRFIIFEAIPDNCKRFNYDIHEIIDLLEQNNFQTFCYNTSYNEFEKINITLYLSAPDKFLFDLFAVKDTSLLKDVKWA